MNKSAYKLPIALPLSILALSSTGIQADVTPELKSLMKEFEHELAILKGRVDGLEARVGELEATQFSTTTKLKGTATFLIGGGTDSNTAQGAGFNPRLNFDTSFTGQDRLSTRITAGAGHSENANEEFSYWGKSTDFYSFSAEIFYTFPVSDLGLGYVGAGIGYYRFDKDIPTRDNDDNEIYDFDVSLGLYLKFNDRFGFSTKNSFSQSGAGGFGRTLRQGVLENDLTTIYSENHFNFDFSDNFSGSLGLRYKSFDESGERWRDSNDHNFIQEFSYSAGDGSPRFYLNGVYGKRDYKYDYMDFDSSYYQVNAGVRGVFPCGVSYDGAFGHEWRDYDYDYFGKRDDSRFELSLFGSPAEGMTLAFLAGYGVHNIFPNYGGIDMADPYGWLYKLQLQQSFGDLGDIGIAIEYTDLEEQINKSSSMDFERLSTEIYYNFPISDNIIITPSVTFINIDGGSQDDDFIVGTIRTTFKF